MEPNESNTKPQSTGGLKLMTVFVVVLALHVVVIGSMCGYYLLKGPSPDTDLLTDKTHKTLKAMPDGTLVSDGQMPEAGDKSATASTAPGDSAGGASVPAPAPTADPTASTDVGSAPTPASAATPPAPTTTVLNSGAPSSIPFRTDSTARVITLPPTTVPKTPDVAATAASTAAGGVPYVVKAHDSLARIAHQNHTSVAKLKAANSLNSDLLRIGQKLMIPNRAPVTATAVAATTTSDAPAGAMIAAGPAPAAKPGATASNHNLYTVVKGDTLTKIAHKFKTTPTALMTANNLTDAAKLSIGKKLKIPAKEARSAGNSEPAATQPAQVRTQPGAAKTAQLANVEQP